MKIMKNVFLWLLPFFLSGCATKMAVNNVAYQSVRGEKGTISPKIIPEESSILVRHSINSNGILSIAIENLTDSIMTIDKTKSFFIHNGTSTPFYSPVVKTTSVTDYSSEGKTATLNVGAVAGAMGVSGAVGKALNGVNIGGETINGTSVNNTTYQIDLPEVNIGPRGSITLGQEFQIEGMGKGFLNDLSTQLPTKDDFTLYANNASESVSSFCVTITYSLDEGQTKQRITSTYYTDNIYISFLKKFGHVNESLRTIYKKYPDALDRSWYLIYLNSTPVNNQILENNLYNHQ